LLGRNEFEPGTPEGDEPDLGGNEETFENRRPKPFSPYIYFDQSTTFMGLAGVPVPLPAGVFATFYPVGHRYEGCLRSFTLDEEINSGTGVDDRGVYKPLTFTTSSSHSGKFAGYGYRKIPQGNQNSRVAYKRYTYKRFVKIPQIEDFPPYKMGRKVDVTRGVIRNCKEGRTSAKYATKTNQYNITVPDLSDPVVNDEYVEESDGLSCLGINEYLPADLIFENYTTSIAWDNILGEAVSVNQSRDGDGSYSCIVDSLVNETFIQEAIASGQSYVTKLSDESVAIIVIVNGKQFYAYQPFNDEVGTEYMLYHEAVGWVDIDVVHDQTANDFVNAMFYVGKTIAVSSFVVANIVVGGTVVGLAVTAYGPAAGIAASIGIDLAFATVEGGIVLFITDDVEKAKVAFQLGAAGALLGGGLEIVALQAVKSVSKNLRAVFVQSTK
jgi:hypothetical protein